MNIIKNEILKTFKKSIEVKTGESVEQIMIQRFEHIDQSSISFKLKNSKVIYNEIIPKSNATVLNRLLVPKLKRELKTEKGEDIIFLKFSAAIDFSKSNDIDVITEYLLPESSETQYNYKKF